MDISSNTLRELRIVRVVPTGLGPPIVQIAWRQLARASTQPALRGSYAACPRGG